MGGRGGRRGGRGRGRSGGGARYEVVAFESLSLTPAAALVGVLDSEAESVARFAFDYAALPPKGRGALRAMVSPRGLEGLRAVHRDRVAGEIASGHLRG